MSHEHATRALVELMQIGKTSSGADRVLHDTPEAFDRIEVMATMGRQEMEAKLILIVVEGRVKLMRPMHATAVDDHDDLFASFTKDTHNLMDILAQLLGIKMGHDLREDFRGAILNSPDNAEQHAARDAPPGAILHPRLAFAAFFAFDLALAQRACGQAIPLGAAPPAQPGQGKAPHDRFIFIEQDDLPSTGSVLQGGELKRAVGEISRGGSEPSSGPAVA
jgi:hypothetical protein